MVEANSGLGGPQKTLQEFAQRLSHRWDVVVALPEGYLANALRSQRGIDVLLLPTASGRASSWTVRARHLVQATRSQRADVIHANGFSALNIVGPVALRDRSPVLVHFHASQVSARMHVLRAAWQRLGVRMGVVAVSEFSRGLLEASGVPKLVRGVLPNPVDLFQYQIHRNGVHAPFRVGFLGSRSPRKGLDLFIDLATLMPNDDVHWWVYGIDPERNRTEYLERCLQRIDERGLSDRFFWGGRLEDPTPAFGEIDALVIPSRQESFGRVAIEGMASGLPIIASRIPGLSEVVWDGHSGLLFDPNHLEEARSHLLRILTDERFRRRLARAGSESARRFDTGFLVSSLEDHYKGLMRCP